MTWIVCLVETLDVEQSSMEAVSLSAGYTGAEGNTQVSTTQERVY